MFRKKQENAQKAGTSGDVRLTVSLDNNISLLKNVLHNDETVVFRELKNIRQRSFRCCLIYIGGMINGDMANSSILRPLMTADIRPEKADGDLLDFLCDKVINSHEITRTADINLLFTTLFGGDAVLLLDGCDEALLIGCREMRERALVEPELERVMRGPKEGFNESIMTNLMLLRRRLKTQDLKFNFRELGVRTKTRICICYIDTLASDGILKELESRLDKINTDAVLAANYIEERIKDSPLSPFKTIGNTERPDVVAAKLLEGRIAVVVDGTPSVLTLPFVFMEYFQSPDDYYNNYWFASINRLLRCLSEFFTSSIPAIYVALVTYHHEMIPTQLLLSITAARQNVPFPTIIEALILLFILEVIREAGLRMPSPMGQAVSIVGTLILGQAAIDARLFSAPMIVIVAATGITGLITIKLKGATTLIRLILLLLSSFMGLYGYIFGVIGASIHLFSMRSFGVSYMMNFGAIYPVDLKDTVIRAPWWYMKYRPKQMAFKNPNRQNSNGRKSDS